ALAPRRRAARDPDRDLALVRPAAVVLDPRADAVLPARARLERELRDVGRRLDRPPLRRLLDLAPLALVVLLPDEPNGLERDLPARDERAVYVARDRLDLDRLPLLEERPRGAEADVEVGGMHEQRRAARPRLPVHVGDGRVRL